MATGGDKVGAASDAYPAIDSTGRGTFAVAGWRQRLRRQNSGRRYRLSNRGRRVGLFRQRARSREKKVRSPPSEKGSPRQHSRSRSRCRRRLPHHQQRDRWRPSRAQGSFRQRDSPNNCSSLHRRGRPALLVTPQPSPTTAPSARPPPPSPVTLPPQPLLSEALSVTGMTLLTPEAVLALETSPQSANTPAELPMPRTSPTTPGEAQDGRSSGPASTSESHPAPPPTVSPTPTENGQPQEEPPKCVCYEALAAPVINPDSCPHQLHLPCYAALRVRVATDLRCPACRATVTVEKADRQALRQHSEEVMAEVMTVARREVPAKEGRG